MATAKAKAKALDTSAPQERVDAELVEDDFVLQDQDEVVASGEAYDFEASAENAEAARRVGAPGEPVVLSEPSAQMNPYVSEEEQGMEMRPAVVGPPAYGSPEAITSASRLVPLNQHLLANLDEDNPLGISDDYGQGYDGTLKGTATITTAPGAPGGEAAAAEGEEIDATAGAKELAEAEGVDLADVEGTGEGGRITKPDVEAYLSGNGS